MSVEGIAKVITQVKAFCRRYITLQQQVTVNSLKYDGSIRRTWDCRLIARDADLLTFVGEFEEDVKHKELGLIRRGTISYEYYWLDRWYNIFRFHEPDGALRNFYCNVSMPPRFENSILAYVDLDIDILVWKDFSSKVLDMEDFEENAVKYRYPDDVKGMAYQSLEDLTRMIERREFPFDHSPVRDPERN